MTRRGIPLTAEQIAMAAEAGSDTRLGQRRIVYRLYREQDDSDLWPVCGVFNVTERAIRRMRAFEAETDALTTFELALSLEAEMSRIVNER